MVGQTRISEVISKHLAIQSGTIDEGTKPPALARKKALYDKSVSEGDPLTVDASEVAAILDRPAAAAATHDHDSAFA